MSLQEGTQAQDRWQKALAEYCRKTHMSVPVFSISSDRRGIRTAWSSTVTVNGHKFSARYWYDGDHMYNAKEDASEVALQAFGQLPRSTRPLLGGQC